MKMKKILALILCVATVFTLVSADVFAASYTLTVKSNDGTQTLFIASVQSGEEIIFTSEGLVTDSDIYTYAGEKDFVGFHTYSSRTNVSYAAGMTESVTGDKTLYIVEADKRAHTIVGDAVPGATTYELYEQITDNELFLRDGYPYYLIFKRQSSGYNPQYFILNLKTPQLSMSYEKEGEVNGVTYYKKYLNYDGYRCTDKDFLTTFDKFNSVTSVTSKFYVTNVSYQNGSYVDDAEYELLYANFESDALSEFAITERLFLSKKLLESSSVLHFDLENLELESGNYDFVVKAKGPGYYDSDFSNVVEYTHTKKYEISYNATNATIEDVDGGAAMEKVYDSRPLSVKIQPAAGYLQPDTVTVTMNGAALSSSQYKYYPETGNLVILNVKGDIVITAQGIKKVASPSIERNYNEETIEYPLALTFAIVENAVGYTVYVDGAAVSAEHTINGNIVTMKVPKEVFTMSGTCSVYVVAAPAEGYTASSPSNTLETMVSIQVATPVATVRDDLKTDTYPFVCSVTRPALSGNLQAWINGNYCGNVTYETDTNGDWIAYFPASVFDGSSESYEIYFVALGENINIVESDSSNRLVFGISKLSAPVIRLE